LGNRAPVTSKEASAHASAAPTPIGQGEIAALAAMPSDPTGTSTFERFRWQAKLAVRAWLGLLVDDEKIAVVCEHVEDLALVSTSVVRFTQLKTRDKGSWSAAKIFEDGHAIHRLVYSYIIAETAGLLAVSKFEVWLEGPPSEAKPTTDFFGNPGTATSAQKQKLRGFGLPNRKVDDFLSRLAIHCHQPARQSVDAVVIRLIGATWPSLTMDQVERLYEVLLQAAEAAQSAAEPPPSMRAAIASARGDPNAPHAWDPISAQALTESQLRALCPPLPTDTDENLLARASAGGVTVLELKLARAGASRQTVEQALLARADADVAAIAGRASGVLSFSSEQALDSRVVTSGNSIVSAAASNASGPQRPAELVFHTMMSNVANTAALDRDGVYGRDHRLVIGHLCSVSDQCRFSWGAS